MKRNELLTIAIPTYNRPVSLEEILIQLEKEINEEVVIQISDDSITDDVHKVVRKYQRKIKNLYYNKNSKNLGFSGNVCKLYEIADTKYIWFLCDDDSVLPGAVKAILATLKKHNPVVAVFNCTWINPFGQKCEAGVIRDRVYRDIADISDYSSLMRMTYLSILVFEKKENIESVKNTNYKDNVFFQITLALFLLNKRFYFIEAAHTIVHRNVGYKYGEFFKFNLVDHMKAVTALDSEFDAKKFADWTIKEIPNYLQLYLSQKIGLFKYNSKPTKETKQLLKLYFGFYTIFLSLFVVIYYSIPSFVLKQLYRLVLFRVHGIKNGEAIFRENVDRAETDTRKTAFIKYR